MDMVDVRGLSCPLPVIKTKKFIDQGINSLLVVGTSQVSKENVGKLAISHGYQITMKVDKKDSWEMQLDK
ncbi:MAG: sulfurtransferase TusA family protein [Syntrophomonas sp.]